MNPSCPGCGGAKSKRARLCAACRRRANAVGADVLQQLPTAAPRAREVARTPQQNIVYHARCSDLAKLEFAGQHVTSSQLRMRVIEVKALTMMKASQRFGRKIESSTELTEPEMEQVLELLDQELKRRLPAAIAAES